MKESVYYLSVANLLYMYNKLYTLNMRKISQLKHS